MISERDTHTQTETERKRETERDGERERALELKKTIFYKDCSLVSERERERWGADRQAGTQIYTFGDGRMLEGCVWGGGGRGGCGRQANRHRQGDHPKQRITTKPKQTISNMCV